MKAATAGIHGGRLAEDTGAMSPPVYQTVSFSFGSAREIADVFQGRAPGFIYTRIANPTTLELERRITELEGGVGCIATASGMAAITTTMIGLLRPGDEILSARGVFGGTASLFRRTLSRFGITTKFVDVSSTPDFVKNISDATRVVFLETICNPSMDVPDVRAIADEARDRKIPVVVDSTLTTPALVRPRELGADIVVHSTSKYINGHGTAIGGAIVDTGLYNWTEGPFDDVKEVARQAGGMAFLAHLRRLIFRDLGGCPAPSNSALMLQGLETLSPRMDIHCSNASNLAELLKGHDQVAWVNYPGLPSSPTAELVKSQFGGRGGGLLTFGLGSKDRAYQFIDALALLKNSANLGDAKTMVIHPASTIFSEYDADTRAEMGVPEDMVRLSVGIEDIEDLREDISDALAQLSGRKS